jgi:hypothetical protein
MAVNLYTNCLTVTTGCYFYNNSNLTSPVSNGKYSDGTNCYTVSGDNGEITSMTTCSSGTVYININGPSSADNTGETGSGNSQIVSQSVTTFSSNSDFVNVVSNLEIYAVCYGENNTSYDLRYINIGDHCASGVLFTGLDPFELIDAYFVISVSPTSDGTYNYATGTGFRDSTYTC